MILLAAVGFAGIGTTTAVLAVQNPDLFNAMIKTYEYGLKGLEKYFEFLIDVFKEYIKAL